MEWNYRTSWGEVTLYPRGVRWICGVHVTSNAHQGSRGSLRLSPCEALKVEPLTYVVSWGIMTLQTDAMGPAVVGQCMCSSICAHGFLGSFVTFLSKRRRLNVGRTHEVENTTFWTRCVRVHWPTLAQGRTAHSAKPIQCIWEHILLSARVYFVTVRRSVAFFNSASENDAQPKLFLLFYLSPLRKFCGIIPRNCVAPVKNFDSSVQR